MHVRSRESRKISRRCDSSSAIWFKSKSSRSLFQQATTKDWHGLPIATATLTKINDDFAKKVELKQEQALSELKDAAVKNLDET